MTGKTTIYIKQTGTPRIPVTVRIEWQPDGKIKPLMYWAPDGSCYEVVRIYESIQLAYLKDRGEGIRFKIRAQLKNPSEYDDLRYARHETYMYFTDNRFCEKGFVDERYQHTNKKYIPITMDVFPNGDYELVYFRVDDNRYIVERTKDKEQRGSFFAGGIGVRHDVDARLVNPDNDEDLDPHNSTCRPAALYWELNKWFIAVKAA